MMSFARRGFRGIPVAAMAALVCSLGSVALFASPASAATVTVTNNHDSGAGSLRAALKAATGATTINVKAGLGTITLDSPVVFPDVSPASVIIHGNGITIDANGKVSGLISNAGSLSFDDFTITGVGGTANTDAGAIVAEGGALHVANCTVHGNAVHASSHDAGALLSEGDALSVSSCNVSNNTVKTDGENGDAGILISEGGGINASGCTVSSNHVNAQGDGATLLSEGGALVVSSCAISHNTVGAGGDVGGGADSEGGNTTFRQVTDTCNTGTSDGGDAAGGLLSEGGDATISGSTVAGNKATTTGDGSVKQQINSRSTPPSISSSTVSDSTDICKTAVSTTTTTETTSTTTATVPETAASVPPTTVAAAELPRTGSSSSLLGVLGFALVAIGAALAFGTSTMRRRRDANA
jgi:LPXTG-motif cell wall-anchored protein